MGENPLQPAEKGDIIQDREYKQDPETGLMMGSTSEGGGSSSDGDGGESSGKSEPSKPSATDANKLKVKGFKNKQKLNNHWKNGRTHKDEYAEDGIFTAEQYEQRAVELLESPTDDNILGHIDKNNFIIRYDISKNDFVKGSVDGGIKTMFKPKSGYDYYTNQQKEDKNHGGKA